MPAQKQQLLAAVSAQLAPTFATPPEPAKRAVFDEVVYAIIREGISTPDADAAFDRVKQSFFDWNEVRVSTIQEVADVLVPLKHPGEKATRIIGFVQEHFERTYSFELEDLEKKGLKQSAKQLARYREKGVSDFAVAWVSRHSFHGHALPLDEPVRRVLRRLQVLDDIADPDEAEAAIASLEHAVPKAKGWGLTEGLTALAATICVAGEPLCVKCPLNAICPTGIEKLAKGKGKGKA